MLCADFSFDSGHLSVLQSAFCDRQKALQNNFKANMGIFDSTKVRLFRDHAGSSTIFGFIEEADRSARFPARTCLDHNRRRAVCEIPQSLLCCSRAVAVLLQQKPATKPGVMKQCEHPVNPSGE